jgi:hypothetical protein
VSLLDDINSFQNLSLNRVQRLWIGYHGPTRYSRCYPWLNDSNHGLCGAIYLLKSHGYIGWTVNTTLHCLRKRFTTPRCSIYINFESGHEIQCLGPFCEVIKSGLKIDCLLPLRSRILDSNSTLELSATMTFPNFQKKIAHLVSTDLAKLKPLLLQRSFVCIILFSSVFSKAVKLLMPC